MPAEEACEAPPGTETAPDAEEHVPGPFPQDQIAEVLLEHARWVCSDLAQRIDTMTQRAGVLFGAALTLATLWTAIVLVVAADYPIALVIGCVFALGAYSIPIRYSLSGLTTKTYHSLGINSITGYLGSNGRPRAGDWPDIHNRLLNDLVKPSDLDSDSVLQGMENDVNRRADSIRKAEGTLLGVTAIALLALITTYLIWRMK